MRRMSEFLYLILIDHQMKLGTISSSNICAWQIVRVQFSVRNTQKPCADMQPPVQLRACAREIDRCCVKLAHTEICICQRGVGRVDQSNYLVQVRREKNSDRISSQHAPTKMQLFSTPFSPAYSPEF